MTAVDGSKVNAGSTWYYDLDLSKGNITGLIIMFYEGSDLKQSVDITTNLPTVAGEYEIKPTWSWSNGKFQAAITAK